MSLIHEYLQATQDQSRPDAGEPLAPPALMPDRKPKPGKWSLKAIILTACLVAAAPGVLIARDMWPDGGPSRSATEARAQEVKESVERRAAAASIQDSRAASVQGQTIRRSVSRPAPPPPPEPAPEPASTPAPSPQARETIPASALDGYDDWAPSAVYVSSQSKQDADSGGRQSPRKPKPTYTPQDPASCFQSALAAQKAGRFKEAEAMYKAGLAKWPGNVKLAVNLAAGYIEQQRLAEAEAVLTRAEEASPGGAKVLVNLGLLAFKRSEVDRAEEYFTRALENDPYNTAALTNLAYLAGESGDREALEGYFQRLVRAAPNNMDALLSYAALLEKDRRFGEAADMYRRALEVKAPNRAPELRSEIRRRIQVLNQYRRRTQHRP